jgi:hypothetical protein
MAEDKDWLGKILIGGVISIIPIVNFAGQGYWVTTLKNVAEGQDVPLPDWSDFGNLFIRGLLVWVAQFIYVFPLILVWCPFIVIAALTTDRRGEMSAIGVILSLCLACMVALYILLVLTILPAAITRYALTGNFTAFFSFGDIVRYIGANLGNYALALIVSLIAVVLAGFGWILCLIGIIFTSFWAQLVYAHLLGQVARAGAQSVVPS